jgi:hypothetical protein
MEENNIVKYEGGIIKRISNQIGVTNKLLELSEPQLIPYRKGDRWGFCTTDKKVIIKPEYGNVSFFSNGLATVKQNGKFGYIDKSGNLIIPIIYDHASNFFENVAHVEIDKAGSRCCIDKKGREIVNFKPNTNKEELRKRLGENSKWGFINRQGIEVIAYKYDNVNPFRDDLASVELNNKWGFIDKNENVIIPFIYDNAGVFKGGVTSVKQNDKYGFIDKRGNILLPFIYKDAHNFYQDIASVKLNGKWGFIDKNGEIIIPFKYDFAFSFSKGFASVEYNGKDGYINKQGVEYWEE